MGFDPLTALAADNQEFIDKLYQEYKKNPGALSPQWQKFFSKDLREVFPDLNVSASVHPPVQPTQEDFLFSQKSWRLLQDYRTHGHQSARLDPLDLASPRPFIEPESYGLSARDLEEPLPQDPIWGAAAGLTLTELLPRLRTAYSGTLGAEFMHLPHPHEQEWVWQALEEPAPPPHASVRLEHLKMLNSADGFEKFLGKKYPTGKRFGLEGGESLIPALEYTFQKVAKAGIQEVVLGMAHRGRLNVMAHNLAISYTNILALFGKQQPQGLGSGDVKYHRGASARRTFGKHTLDISLTPNPSHLESVNAVVLGKVRAKQQTGKPTLGLLIHGDASFPGQGIVAESLGMSRLEGYATGGTLHIILNNQVGFTADPIQGRSTGSCADLAKFIQAPIFHVNGDDVEAVVRALSLAFDFLHHFRKDVVVDIVCYRRRGHNEMDEPTFTQPLMYQKIVQHPTTQALYEASLIQSGVLTADMAQQLRQDQQEHLDNAFKGLGSHTPPPIDWLQGNWKGLTPPPEEEDREEPTTGVPTAQLQNFAKQLSTIPAGFALHSKLQRLVKPQKDINIESQTVQWALAEALAFGTLLVEGTPVRLSGQDSGRGTFTQRHSIWTDQNTGATHIPLNHLDSKQAFAEIINSPLSEAAVLGFEWGYSTTTPHSLVLWEAQFGDFANGAQVIIDQYIAASASKWQKLSGLVMLLPHGYEGQGPEHSSARLERFLQLCASGNMEVVNCSTSANYFHCLRRQMHRPFRRPLIIMTPKSLLRHPEASSALMDMGENTKFETVMGESADGSPVEQVILCSGKVYYDLLQHRTAQKAQHIALIRLEQLYPFPQNRLAAELKKYTCKNVAWCQEEPANAGAWSFLRPLLDNVLLSQGKQRAIYAGRPASASTATGYAEQHHTEQNALLNQAFTVSPRG